jgi:hypothetical protein
MPNAFGSLPFNKLDSIDSITLHDDFINGALLADLVDGTGVLYLGDYDWFGTEIAGAAVSNVTKVTAVADHPGVIALNVGATSPADGDAAALQFGRDGASVQESVIFDSNGVYIAMVLRLPDVDAQKTEFGFCGQAPAAVNSSALDIVAWVWDPEDAVNVGDEFWIAQVNGAGTDTEEATSLAYVQNDWVLLEIAVDDTSAVFRITTEDGSDTINIVDTATIPIVGMRPYVNVENVGNAEELVAIDSFQIRYLRRNTPYGTSGYLGA